MILLNDPSGNFFCFAPSMIGSKIRPLETRRLAMNRILVFVLLTAMTALGTEIPSRSLSSDQAAGVTFNKDVLPILQKNCQACHRTGEVAPMSFLTYEGTRPWAKAIKAAVVTKKMPPWFADPHVGEFRNAPNLTE